MKGKEFISKAKEIKEIKEKEPEMRLKFFFLAHFKKEDFVLLREEIKKCDVYIPESPEHGSSIFNVLQKTSFGELNPEELAQKYKEKYHKDLPGRLRGTLGALYNLEKPVYLADVPEGHELTLELKEAKKADDLAFLDFISGNFTRAQNNKRKYMELFIRFQQKRENYIKENIERLKPQIFKDYPHLRRQKEIKILASIGAVHTHAYHQFKKEKKISTQRKFSSLPIVYDITHELQRKKLISPEKEIEDTKIAQSFMEEIFFRS